MRKSEFIKKASMRGIASLLLSEQLVSNLAKATLPGVQSDKPEEDDKVRKVLLETLAKQNVNLVTPDNVKPGEQVPNNAYYIPSKRQITLGKEYQGNHVLAHEMGHHDGAEILLPMNTGGKSLTTISALLAALTPRKAARFSALGLGGLGGASTLASELDASARGYNIMGKAGEEDFTDKIRTFAGIPSYMLFAGLPMLTYKGRKLMGAFKDVD